MSERSTTVKKKKKWGKVYEYTPIRREFALSDELTQEIEKDLKSLKVTTPESFALKHGIKISLAKMILNDNVEAGKLKIDHKGQKTTVYAK